MEQGDGGDHGISRLPLEILTMIFDLLDASDLIDSVRLTCRRFYGVLSGDGYWRLRLRKKFAPASFPAVAVDEYSFLWLEEAASYDREVEPWRRCSEIAALQKETCVGVVDSVHWLTPKLLAAGARSRDITLYHNPSEHDGEKTSTTTIMAAHKGWIWSMGNFDDSRKLVTTSWDSTVKIWDIDAITSNPISTMRCQSAILCNAVDTHNQMIYAGAYDKHIYVIDIRSNIVTLKKKAHANAILCISQFEVGSPYVIMGSEDSTLSIFDTRSQQILSRLKLDNYPTSLSARWNECWVGDKTGAQHVISTTSSRDEVRIMKTFEATEVYGDADEIEAISPGLRLISTKETIHHGGVVVSANAAGVISMRNPTLSGSTVKVFKAGVKHRDQLSSLDFRFGNIAIGTTSGDVVVHQPLLPF